jgi:hypothetical protein
MVSSLILFVLFVNVDTQIFQNVVNAMFKDLRAARVLQYDSYHPVETLDGKR